MYVAVETVDIVTFSSQYTTQCLDSGEFSFSLMAAVQLLLGCSSHLAAQILGCVAVLWSSGYLFYVEEKWKCLSCCLI